MAEDARQDGDFETAELFTSVAMKYFGEADRLEARWRNFEARFDNGASRRSDEARKEAA